MSDAEVAIRVVIVEDSPTMRAILKTRLERAGDITVVGAAADAAQGRQMIRELDPDVVTLDVEMPGMNGLDFLDKIMKKFNLHNEKNKIPFIYLFLGSVVTIKLL